MKNGWNSIGKTLIFQGTGRKTPLKIICLFLCFCTLCGDYGVLYDSPPEWETPHSDFPGHRQRNNPKDYLTFCVLLHSVRWLCEKSTIPLRGGKRDQWSQIPSRANFRLIYSASICNLQLVVFGVMWDVWCEMCNVQFVWCGVMWDVWCVMNCTFCALHIVCIAHRTLHCTFYCTLHIALHIAHRTLHCTLHIWGCVGGRSPPTYVSGVLCVVSGV